jgi:hypothetical protein
MSPASSTSAVLGSTAAMASSARCERQNGYRTRVSTRRRAAIANTGNTPVGRR